MAYILFDWINYCITYFFVWWMSASKKTNKREWLFVFVAMLFVALLGEISPPLMFATFLLFTICIRYYFRRNVILIVGSLAYFLVFEIIVDQALISLLPEQDVQQLWDNYFLTSIVLDIGIGCLVAVFNGMRYLLSRRIENYRAFDQIIMLLGIVLSLMLFIPTLFTLLPIYTDSTRLLATINIAFFAVFAIILLFAIYLYLRSNQKEMQVKLKKAEYESLNRYVLMVESNSQSMRKFKHDLNNIMRSMEGFFQKDDYEGLKAYYYDQFLPNAEGIAQNNFQLDRLSCIKNQAVKSLVFSKLLEAQNKDIEVFVELTQGIDQFYIEDIDLIRILGILLDNAIEELECLESGKLIFAVFSGDQSVDIIVQNNARPSVYKINQLKEDGFSTKGSNRGFGLVNLKELIDKYPHALLETVFKDGLFTQHILLMEARGDD